MTKDKIMRIIAAALVVLALGTLFLDGIGLSNELMAEISSEMGGIDSVISESITDVDASDLADLFGIYTSDIPDMFNTQDAINTVKGFANAYMSGGLSMMETRSILATGAKLADSMMALAAMSGESLDELSYLKTANIAYTAFVVLIFLLGAWALYGIYKHRKARGIPFAVFMLLILIGDAVIAFAANSSIRSAAGSSSVSLFSVTPWTIAGFLLALASVVLCFMAAGNAVQSTVQPSGGFVGQGASRPSGFTGGARNAKPVFSTNSGWTCPQCGSAVEAGGMFCGSCGAPKPQAEAPRKLQCAQCGFELADDAAFCPQCGSRVTSAEPQQPAYAQPAASAYQPQQPVYAQPESDLYQPQQPQQSAYEQPAYEQPVGGGYQAATDPWIQQSAPQASSGSGTVRTVVQDTPITLTFEIDQPLSGTREVRTYSLTSSLIVGRKAPCDLQIDDGTVSSAHLKISRAGEAVFVTDLNSTNGTKLNGSPLTGEAPLSSGDALEIGHTVLTVRY